MIKIQELKDKKIDTIVCYYVNCTGEPPRLMLPDSCIAYDIKYLLWIDRNMCFFQRFDECFEYKPAKNSRQFFYLLKHNYHKIRHEEIKSPEYDVIINGKHNINTVVQDHSCHTIFEIQLGVNVIRKDIDAFDLETKYVDEKHLSKNYYPNKKSALNKLKIIIEKEVALYNKNPHNKKGAQ